MIEKRTFGGIVADIIIWIIVGALALSCLMPLMNIVAISLSDNAAVSANLVNIFPIGFNISSYQEIMGDKQFWRSFGISVLRVVLGLSVNITLLVLTAYPAVQEPQVLHRTEGIYVLNPVRHAVFRRPDSHLYGGEFTEADQYDLGADIAGSRAAGECDSADERLPGSAQIIGGGRHD